MTYQYLSCLVSRKRAVKGARNEFKRSVCFESHVCIFHTSDWLKIMILLAVAFTVLINDSLVR